MGRNGKPTRDKILAESKALIYENGFAGTSIDNILEKTGITKGAFFYHFKTKAELARVLMNEFVEADIKELENVMHQTEGFSDPKERLMKFIEYFIELFSDFTEPPGCLYASVSNEQNQYSDEIKLIVKDTMLRWRLVVENLLNEVVKNDTPKVEVDVIALADQFNVVIEGAFVMSKALNDPSLTPKQLIHYKKYLELLFN